MTQAQRKVFKRYIELHETAMVDWALRGYEAHYTPTLQLPDSLLDMCCEARTRAGSPCKQKSIYKNGRCKWHGGLSTGPKTELGKQQCRINGRLGGRPAKPKS